MSCEDESCAFAETHYSKVAERNTFLYMLNTEKGTPTTCGRALRVIEFLRIFLFSRIEQLLANNLLAVLNNDALEAL